MGDRRAKPVYRAVFERDDNDTWFVRVPDVQGAHSFGKTLVRAERNIKEALALVLDVDEDSFDLEREVNLPSGARAVVAEAQRYREIAALGQRMSVTARARAVEALSSGSSPLSLRDIAELVGTSFQRIQQIRVDQGPRSLGEERVGYDDDTAEVVNLMAALNVSVEAARRARHASEPEDWSAAWMAVARPDETLGEGALSDFLDALRACLDSVRGSLEMIRWSVGVPVTEDNDEPRARDVRCPRSRNPVRPPESEAPTATG